MNNLSKQEIEFVTLGAALASNCVPCIIHHIAESQKLGISDEQIKEAIEVADKVRRFPARKILDTAYARLNGQGDAGIESTDSVPPCCKH